MSTKIALTGERPLGQERTAADIAYLEQLFAYQASHRCFFMIADYQAFASRTFDPGRAEGRVRSLVCDYLAAGLDPERSVCFLQSQVPQLFELGTILSNLVTVDRLKQSLSDAGMDAETMPFGFIGIPISQAADILLFCADLVPCRGDQRPMVELASNVGERFNDSYGEVFRLPAGAYLEADGSRVDPAEFRERRRAAADNGARIMGILSAGGSEARVAGQRTLEHVREAVGSVYEGVY